MNNISLFDVCTNCGACKNVCSVQAITVDTDGLFFVPKVNAEKCLECGKCIAVCPANNPEEQKKPIAAFGGYHQDHLLVKSSSSGGAFSALAQRVLDDGGVVYGACYEKNHRGVAIKSTDEVPLSALRKSKYVESDVRDTFVDVQQKLSAGRKVLYCATPCQIAGLRRFLNREYENLLLCDFSCGGLPSHVLYEKHLSELEENYGAKVSSVDFRPKTLGWENHAIKITFQNGKTYHRPARLDPYFSAFIGEHVSVRENCLSCGFSENHYSDIILADFWKCNSLSSFSNTHKGLSLLIANTEKGLAAIQSLSPEFSLEKLELTGASYNLKKTEPSEEQLQKRRTFLDRCTSVGLRAAAEEQFPLTTKEKLLISIKTAFKQRLWGVK